jgi:hypothetical protein
MQYSRISSQDIGYLRLFLDLLSDDSGKFPKNGKNSGKNQIRQSVTKKTKTSVTAKK